MEISLDYYRILSVPVQADLALIEQAYHDRIAQLPHQGYTEYAVNSRKKLIEQAYSILGQEESRLEYEASFFPSTEAQLEEISEDELENDVDLDIIPEIKIEIEEDLFIGALIILLDLGEYELILNLAQPYLQDKNSLNNLTDLSEEIPQIWQDLVLTVVLAYLELAREQWQDKQYEFASNSLQNSYNLLFKEDLFPTLRKEIKQDLGKLRPYQILELLTKENTTIVDREKAIKLLKLMLNSRGGIENKKVDESGLNIESFLRFIQQIRVYLTAEEQQNIFEEESQRPSPAAGYLAAYAGIARGFTERKPEYIIRAKNSLISLTIHQDVYLEQSICALLLGQTAEAEFSLSQSREKKIISYIQEMSQDSPDLLPGLCIYTEKWLQSEVFPQFKNLSGKNPSLQDYFADDRVQNYLETITNSASSESNNHSSSELELPIANNSSYSFTQFNALKEQTDYEEQIINETYGENVSSNVEVAITDESLPQEKVSLLVEDDTIEQEELVALDDFISAEVEDYSPSITDNVENVSEASINHSPPTQLPNPPKAKTSSGNNWQLFFIPVVILIVILGTIVVFASRQLLKGGTSTLEIPLSEPLIELPLPTPPENNLMDKLDKETGLTVINQWLKAKSSATGPEYNPVELNKILTDPLLSKWISINQDLRRQNAYRRYEHQVTIESAEINPQNTTEAVIVANVKEKSQYYRNGALINSQSSNDDLMIKYDLIKENNQWLIKNITVLKQR